MRNSFSQRLSRLVMMPGCGGALEELVRGGMAIWLIERSKWANEKTKGGWTQSAQEKTAEFAESL